MSQYGEVKLPKCDRLAIGGPRPPIGRISYGASLEPTAKVVYEDTDSTMIEGLSWESLRKDTSSPLVMAVMPTTTTSIIIPTATETEVEEIRAVAEMLVEIQADMHYSEYMEYMFKDHTHLIPAFFIVCFDTVKDLGWGYWKYQQYLMLVYRSSQTDFRKVIRRLQLERPEFKDIIETLETMTTAVEKFEVHHNWHECEGGCDDDCTECYECDGDCPDCDVLRVKLNRIFED